MEKEIKEYRIEIMYSWGDEEEPKIYKLPFDLVWDRMMQLAAKEANLICDDHECEVELIVDKTNGTIRLHYIYDDSWCYYKIKENV